MIVERIVYVGELLHKCRHKGGNQAKLDELAKLPEFRQILEKEAVERNLVPHDIERFIKGLYGLVSRYVHGNDGHIIIAKGHFQPDERATMVY